MVQESLEQLRARVDAEVAARHGSSSSSVKRRKRKKRLPRTCGRARHRQRQRHAPGWISVFPSYVGRPKVVGIMVGMDPDDSFLRARRRLQQWQMLDWFGWLLLALCSLLSFTSPRCSASWPILTSFTVT